MDCVDEDTVNAESLSGTGEDSLEVLDYDDVLL